ncbi:MAG: TadE/TadG family type IV pilus assembly protein [Alphaproteobacteria bacterium]
MINRRFRHSSWSRQSERGVAAVEFSLMLPILLVLLLGGMDLTRYMLYQQKVDRISFSVTDLVAQSQSVSVAKMNDIALAAAQIMQPFPFGTQGVIIVSSIYKDPTQSFPVIRWQYIGGGTLGRGSKIGNVNGTPTLPNGLTLNDKDNVIITEAYYVFDPVFHSGYIPVSDIYKIAIYKPRLGALLSLPAT